MELSLSELLKFAEANAEKEFDLTHQLDWLAAKCATQLSDNKAQRMSGYHAFEAGCLYSSVPDVYGDWCKVQRKYLFTGKEMAAAIREMMGEIPESDEPIVIGG